MNIEIEKGEIKLTRHDAIWEHTFKLVDSLQCQIKAFIKTYIPFSYYMTEEDFYQMAYEAAYDAIDVFLEKETKKKSITTENKKSAMVNEISKYEDILKSYFIVTYRRMCSNTIEANSENCVKYQETDIDTVIDKLSFNINNNEEFKEGDYDKDYDEVIEKALDLMSYKQRRVWKYMLSDEYVSSYRLSKELKMSKQNVSQLINRGLQRAALLSVKEFNSPGKK